MRGQNPLTDFIQAVVRRFRLPDGTVLDLSGVSNSQYLKRNGSSIIGAAPPSGSGLQRTFTFQFDGRGLLIDPLTIPEGVLPFSPMSGRITEVYIKDPDDDTGTAVIDIRAAPRGSGPPDSSDSLVDTGTAPQTTASSEATQTDFSDWATDHIDQYDEVRVVVTSNSGHTKLTVVLTIKPDDDIRLLSFEFDGRGAEIDPVTVLPSVIPFSSVGGTITEAYIKDLEDTAGSCQIDIRSAPRGSAPPNSGDSIVGAGTKPSTSSASESTMTDFSSWDSDQINFQDEIRAVVTSSSGHKHIMLVLTIIP